MSSQRSQSSSLSSDHRVRRPPSPVSQAALDLDSRNYSRNASLSREGHYEGMLHGERQGYPMPDSPMPLQIPDVGQREISSARRLLLLEDRRRRLSDRRESLPHQPSRSTNDSQIFRPQFSPSYDSDRYKQFHSTLAGSAIPSMSPHPTRPSIEHRGSQRMDPIAVPRWQPDEEISVCPICGIAFTFWQRRHHCRKC